ncbi:MAG: TetR/AcrR family transcriptional regulator [Acidimicrobiales bacterium]
MARRRSPGRRDELLAAGERVFCARGVDKSTVEEVTAVAGVAKGTFYLYFHSKSDLLAALRQRFAEDLAAAVAAQTEAEGQNDWFGVLRQRLDATADTFFAQGLRHEVLFHGDAAERATEGEADWAQAIVGALSELTRAGSAAGAFAVSDPELTAVALFHALYGLLHHALHRTPGPDREEVLATAWQLVSRALAPDVPPRLVGHPPATRA